MADQNNEIKFALEFPQGLMFFMKNTDRYTSGDVGSIYFQPQDSAEAFMVWGERKELFGKHAVCVAKDRDRGNEAYNVVYEFTDDGALTDARLVTATETARGTLAGQDVVQGLNEALAQNKIKLYSNQDTELSQIFNAASFEDGRILIQLRNKNELYLGTPGHYQKLDAQLTAQGGCSLFYKLPTGEQIDLHYGIMGPDPNRPPTFNGEEMTYLDVKAGSDPKVLGLDLSGGVRHRTPFSPKP